MWQYQYFNWKPEADSYTQTTFHLKALIPKSTQSITVSCVHVLLPLGIITLHPLAQNRYPKMSNNDPNCIPVKSKGSYSFQFHSKRLSRSPSINERDKLQVIYASAVITLLKRVQLPRSQTSSARQLKMAPEGPPCLAIQQTMSPDLLSTPPLKNNLKY